ncbi:MAG: hypothetical protein MI923_04370 [Phycisphaerales bacterium]|nr:hypothetical protein [Phycisphaerales bacterium]
MSRRATNNQTTLYVEGRFRVHSSSRRGRSPLASSNGRRFTSDNNGACANKSPGQACLAGALIIGNA